MVAVVVHHVEEVAEVVSAVVEALEMVVVEVEEDSAEVVEEEVPGEDMMIMEAEEKMVEDILVISTGMVEEETAFAQEVEIISAVEEAVVVDADMKGVETDLGPGLPQEDPDANTVDN